MIKLYLFHFTNDGFDLKRVCFLILIDFLSDIGLNGDDPDRWKTSLSRSFLRSGVASFNLGRYAEAKNCFLKGQQHQDEMGIKQWIAWCDEKMQKLGIKDDPDEVKETPKQKVVANENEKSNLKDEKTKIDTPPSTDNAESSSKQENQAVAMPVPKIKHDWYQTETQVILDSEPYCWDEKISNNFRSFIGIKTFL